MFTYVNSHLLTELDLLCFYRIGPCIKILRFPSRWNE